MTACQPLAMSSFPPFDLARLFRTVFRPEPRERVAVFVDLPDPAEAIGFRYLAGRPHEARRHAHDTLYLGLCAARAALGLAAVSFYGYRETGASNLDLPETVVSSTGETLAMREAFARHTIVIFMGRWSATAPATALAKELGVRGATMHGVNDTVIATGLAVDYEQVSARAERLRRALTRADRFRLEWRVPAAARPEIGLVVELGRQEAQKSHGLVRGPGDIANLPAGEVYFVPVGAEGFLPRKLDDAAGTVGIFRIAGGRMVELVEVPHGNRGAAEALMARVAADPAAGTIGELGLGTQSLPFAGTDIQDEKVLGTAHLATGRSDHLGGDLGPAKFRRRENASHDDILYAPHKTPEIELARVFMERDGRSELVLERYRPARFLDPALLDEGPPAAV